MKRYLVFCLTVASMQSFAQSAQVILGTPENEENYPMIRLTNGDYVLAGNTKNIGFGGKDALVTRTDAAGNLIWSKQYGGGGDETAISISETSDGGFVVGGEGFSSDPNGQAFLFKIDGTGVMQWWKEYGGAFYDITYSVQGLADGSIISAGLMEVAFTDYDAFLMKTDANGDTLWTKTIGLLGIEHAVNVTQTADSGFIFCGKALGIGQGVCECWIVKTDMNGDTLWTSVIGGQGWDESMDIVEQPNGYMVCGGSNSVGNSNYDFILMELDLSGNMVWVKQYGGTNAEDAYCLQEIPGEGYILSGYTETYSYTNSRGTDSSNVWLVKTNYAGDTLWSMVYGGNLKEECFSVAVVPNVGFAAAGYSASYGDSLQTFLFMTDTAGYSGCANRRTQPTVISPAFVQTNYSFNVNSGYAVSSPSRSQQNTGASRAVNCGSPLSVAATLPAPGIKYFPNPATQRFTVQAAENIVEVCLISSNGVHTMCTAFDAGNLSHEMNVETPVLAGWYIVEVKLESGAVMNGMLVVPD